MKIVTKLAMWVVRKAMSHPDFSLQVTAAVFDEMIETREMRGQIVDAVVDSNLFERSVERAAEEAIDEYFKFNTNKVDADDVEGLEDAVRSVIQNDIDMPQSWLDAVSKHLTDNDVRSELDLPAYDVADRRFDPRTSARKKDWFLIASTKVDGDGVQAPGAVTLCMVRKGENGTPSEYAVHFFNAQTGGFSNGAYYTDVLDSIKEFIRQGDRFTRHMVLKNDESDVVDVNEDRLGFGLEPAGQPATGH